MSIQTGIRALLLADSGVVTAAPGGIWPTLLPATATYPALVYKLVGGSSDPTVDTSGLQRARMEFDCYGNSEASGYDDADTLRSAVIAALNGAQGELSGGTVLADAALVSPGIDFYEDDSRMYRCMVEFYLLYSL